MQISKSDVTRCCADRDVYAALLARPGLTIVELGCGAAAHAREIAAADPGRQVLAYEVDSEQHAKNLASERPPNLEFRYGGAEAIDLPDASIDLVMMFKSLHHVPPERMDTALDEIARILRPGGLAYISEPVFAGEFNDIIRRFHDEQQVREAAFGALARAVERGPLELAREEFFLAPTHFDGFADFEARIINATHSEHRLDAATLAAVRADFERHCGPAGADFRAPMRVDVLEKPAA